MKIPETWWRQENQRLSQELEELRERLERVRALLYGRLKAVQEVQSEGIPRLLTLQSEGEGRLTRELEAIQVALDQVQAQVLEREEAACGLAERVSSLEERNRRPWWERVFSGEEACV